MVGNDGQFAKFYDVIGRPEWTSDQRFHSNSARVRNQQPLLPMIAEILLQQDLQVWAARCRWA